MNYEEDELMPVEGEDYNQEGDFYEEDDFYDDEDDFYEEDDFYDDEDDFDSGLDGLEEDDIYDDDEDYIEEVEYIEEPDYDSFEGDYDYYKATSIGQIDSNDRTLTIVVKNEGQAEAEAVLFGANENAVQPQGITVSVSESSHDIVKNETYSNPFVVKGVKMSVSSQLQFDQVINITRRSATGSNNVKVWQPRNSTSPQNLSPNLIDDSSFSMEVTPQDSLRFKVLPGVTVVFTFTLIARVNMGNLLKGRNVAELSRTPRTTGLPQLDLKQKKSRKPKRRRTRRRLRKVPKVRSRRVRNPRRIRRKRRPTSRRKLLRRRR